jgi:stage V sporulation protein SpoVS
MGREVWGADLKCGKKLSTLTCVMGARAMPDAIESMALTCYKGLSSGAGSDLFHVCAFGAIRLQNELNVRTDTKEGR